MRKRDRARLIRLQGDALRHAKNASRESALFAPGPMRQKWQEIFEDAVEAGRVGYNLDPTRSQVAAAFNLLRLNLKTIREMR